MTQTRKLAAILAADVVGYARLMGEDEAGTARAVSEHRDAAHPITDNANVRFSANCELHRRDPQCPLNVEPRRRRKRLKRANSGHSATP
jgi:hypothetical protein